ncbi:MAG TPA: protein-methionine-sulfoxide reductase heme-binding subunit MsrQ [Candidatus Acidoferrales bacterium]|nr:protein-methionine-sulfoxide reductase heme-binding subunit MsrQ [Candidatus Acidoferrales bacterium]
MSSFLTNKWTKAALFAVCLVPLGALVYRGLNHQLGANPIEFLTHATGDWTIRFIVLTLAITPLRKTLKIPELIRFRRMLGLFAFFYACLHFSIWIGIDKFFDFTEMWKDIEKRRFITVGMAALLLMVPMAVTSTAGWIRRLGGRRWRMIHRAIYITAILAVIHYYWLVKSDVRLPLTYGALVAVLLAWRAGDWLLRRRNPATIRAASPDAL